LILATAIRLIVLAPALVLVAGQLCVAQTQIPLPQAKPGEKWLLMERVFKL